MSEQELCRGAYPSCVAIEELSTLEIAGGTLGYQPNGMCEMVTLAELRDIDLEIAAQWLSNPDVNEWLTGEWRDKDISSTLVAIAVRNRRNRFFMVRHMGERCGLAVLSDIEFLDKTAMIWYVLGEKKYSGQGVTTDAVRQLVCIAFNQLGLASLYAWIMDGNTASRKVLHKAGFREAGRIRCSSSFRDRQVDRIYFDLIPASA